MFLQKHKDSKRVYAQIVHSKSNSDGAKEDGKSKSQILNDEKIKL